MKQRILVLLSLVLIITATCRREEKLKCKDSNTIKLPQHAIDYFYFKKGTWWVYECKQTLETDSFWVDYDSIIISNPVRAKQDCRCGNGLCYQSRGVIISNTKHNGIPATNYFSGYGIVHNVNDIDIGQTGIVEIRENNKSFSGFPGYRMYYNENVPESPTITGAILGNIDTMTLNGELFKDIMRYNYAGNNDPPDWFRDAYYAKNIYMIKYITRDSLVWTLKKYNIVK